MARRSMESHEDADFKAFKVVSSVAASTLGQSEERYMFPKQASDAQSFVSSFLI